MRIEIPEKKPWNLQKSSSTRSIGKGIVPTQSNTQKLSFFDINQSPSANFS